MRKNIRVHRSEYDAGYDIYITQESDREEDLWVGELVFKKVDLGVSIDPTLRVSRKEVRMGLSPLKSLMDDLWRNGIRPTDEIDNLGQLTATKDHLKDMQKIVFEHFLTDREV